MIELLAALALGGDPSVRPWPVGPGAAYRPAAAARDGRPVSGLRCEAGRPTFPLHLELFAREVGNGQEITMDAHGER